MTSNSQSNVGIVYMLPFLIFFSMIGISLLHPDFDIRDQNEGSLINQITFSSAYLIAFILILKQSGLLSSIFPKVMPLNVLLFLILISAFWSEFPKSVFISFVHNVGIAFIALCMTTLFINNKNNYIKILLLTLFAYMVATIGIGLFRPDIGLMTSSNIYAYTLIGRWRGLTTHPNSLGAICLFSTWVSLTAFFYSQNKKFFSYLAFLNLLCTFFCLYKTKSMTSTLISTALVLGFLWFSFLGKSESGVKGLKIIFGVTSLLVGLISLYIFFPHFFSQKYFFLAIGRDVSLSGRSSLWELGFKGFAEKPYLGWSYDSLRTFLKTYDLGYGNLHNGYLDLLVRGGIISIFFFCVLIVQIVSSLIKQAAKKNKDYVFIAGISIASLVHNMTESTILTTTNIIWLMFLIGYFYLIEINRIKNLTTN